MSSGAPESDHHADIALAAAYAAGDEAAWERFVREFRPGLYRSADAIDPTGSARDLADALFGELFGVRECEGQRQSLFRHFQGRSSLATWLRAVLAQRHVDRIRATRRLIPLPDDNAPPQGRAIRLTSSSMPEPDESGCQAAVRLVLADAIGRLGPRDRLRLGCHYVQDLTLSAIGKMFGEHETTGHRPARLLHPAMARLVFGLTHRTEGSRRVVDVRAGNESRTVPECAADDAMMGTAGGRGPMAILPTTNLRSGSTTSSALPSEGWRDGDPDRHLSSGRHTRLGGELRSHRPAPVSLDGQ